MPWTRSGIPSTLCVPFVCNLLLEVLSLRMQGRLTARSAMASCLDEYVRVAIIIVIKEIKVLLYFFQD